MPYSSSIQVVNDANGTAYAFLEDNGLLWQCQWNAQAQRWDRGQVVPGAFGGDKLQALYLENLWPTTDSNGNNPGTAPGLVLAYRVGEGSSSRVLATIGSWDSDGRLQWSAPLALSETGVDLQAFTLVEGSDGAGFSLVLQTRQSGTPVPAILDQIRAAQPADRPALLSRLDGDRPDSDLYVSSCALSGDGREGWSLTSNLVEGSQPISTAPQTPNPAAPPLALAGNTQLSRAELLSSGQGSGALNAVAPSPAASPASPLQGAWQGWKGGLAAQFNLGGGGKLRLGPQLGQNIARWEWMPAEDETSTFFRLENIPWSDEQSRWEGGLSWSGYFGGTNKGAGGPLSLSAAYIGYGQEKKTRIRKNFFEGLKEEGRTEFRRINKSQSWSLTGYVETDYQFQDYLWNACVTDLTASAGINLDYGEKRLFAVVNPELLESGLTSVRTSFYLSLSFGWSETVSNPDGLPAWVRGLGTLGWLGGDALGNLNLFGKLSKKSPNQSYSDLANRPDLIRGGGNAFNRVAAVVGTALAGAGPLLLLADDPAGNTWQSALSRGWSTYDTGGISARWLSVLGFKGSLTLTAGTFAADSNGPFGSGTRSNNLSLALNAGVTLPLEGYIPMLVWSDSWTWPTTTATRESAGRSTIPASPGGASYPYTYAPAAASNDLLVPSGDTTNQGFLLNGQPQALEWLTLSSYAGPVNAGTGQTAAPLTLVNAGANLKDGSYTAVPILGLGLDGGSAAFASAAFTVSGGSIVASSVVISQGGSCLGLPETQPGSGIHALLLDLFSIGIASPPSGAAANALASLPLITVSSTRSGSPLQIQPIQRIWTVPVDPALQQTGILYPLYDPSTGQARLPASSDYRPYSYNAVPLQLWFTPSGGIPQPIVLLNGQAPTASVVLSQGVIQSVHLDQPLLFTPQQGNGTMSLQLSLPEAVTASLPAATPPPSFGVAAQGVAFNNLVSEEQFNTQSGAPDSGVYLAAGMADQLPPLAQMGAWPTQNRVMYSTRQSNGQLSSLVLNGLRRNAQGGYTPVAAQLPLTLQEAYSDPDIIFTAASSPTAVTISGQAGGTYSGKTLVAWVEASDPVTPARGSDGSSNYQAFMQAYFGQQRINYRINTGQGIWVSPNLGDLYAPDGVVIANLQAFNVADPAHPGANRTLMVWSETDIAAIQRAAPQLGSGLNIPTRLKAGFINPSPLTYQWNDLFRDSSGASTIQTIPWDPTSEVGLTISDISAASLADTTAESPVPVITWSQTVRAPYRQSVLNDQPSLYLEFGALKSGLNSINIGTIQDPDTTATFASDTGLNFAVPGALPKSQAAAVENIQGIGVLSTGLGSRNGTTLQLMRNMASPLAVFSGWLSGSTLTVQDLESGSLQVGDVLSGPGLLAGTTISAIGSIDPRGIGTYSVDQPQTAGAAAAPLTLQALPLPATPALRSFNGAISGTTLTVSALQGGALQVGDGLSGQGIRPGTRVSGLLSIDPDGLGTYSVDQAQSVANSALIALTPEPTAPYTIEFWARLQPGSNGNGAGLVALGQPSAAAIGEAVLPEGWLLGASFVVDRISWQQAVSQRLIAAIPAGTDPGSLYGWGWGVVATGANTTAMGGNGGSNVYSNALQINNLVNGMRLKGVDQFLANYSLGSSDLIGLDGQGAATIVQVPSTQLQVDTFLDSSNNNQPNSTLNAIAVDTASAVLNQGLVLAKDVSAAQANLFSTLWTYQTTTGAAKVNFSLAPDSSETTTIPSALSAEQYSGYALNVSLQRGPAVSVNGLGQLVFDVAPGRSLLMPIGSDLRDGQWHYIAATYLPDYTATTIDGQTVDLPTRTGTAALVVDNRVVASAAGVGGAYAAINLSDQALLLAGNAQGALDQFALYDRALTTMEPSPGVAGFWPEASSADALALLAAAGHPIPGGTPDPGRAAGALTAHWAARAVDPNNALQATTTSAWDPGTGSWSEATPLNPLLQPQASGLSGQAGSLQNDLVISVPATNWTTSTQWQNGIFVNPANRRLQSVSVTLTNSVTQASRTIRLSGDRVLLGNQTLQSLQPLAKDTNLNTTILTAAPVFKLLIPRDQIDLGASYNATYTFSFADAVSVSNAKQVTVNADGSGIAGGGLGGSSVPSNRSKALATAQVIEAAPLQLKYIDSGEVFSSASSPAAANNPGATAPAPSFGQSQVFGTFVNLDNTKSSGWLAIAQPRATNAVANPAGRVWIQYTGQFSINSGKHVAVTDVMDAPTTWLNALANANFSPDSPTLPLLGDAFYPSSVGGLLIQADPTAGWGQQFGATMLVADINADGVEDLVVGAPDANGGGRVVIIDGAWIQANLTSPTGNTILNLANPTALGPHVTVLQPQAPTDPALAIGQAGFGAALAFDGNRLWIGAPNVLKQLDSDGSRPNPTASLKPIGALYSYSPSSSPGSWGSGQTTSIGQPILGTGGTSTSLDPTGRPVTTYWGSQLGTAIAVDPSGAIAVSAPGVVAALEYSGTQQVQQRAAGQKPDASNPYGQGALLRIQLPDGNNHVSIADGSRGPGWTEVVHPDQTDTISAALQPLKPLQTLPIAQASLVNNPAYQVEAVGAVYWFHNSSDLRTLAAGNAAISATAVAGSTGGGATFYGAHPWNVLTPSGFGSSLAFADLTNTNGMPTLAIGADQAGGPGVVYLLDTSQDFNSPSGWVSTIAGLGHNQYLGYLASGFSLYGAESFDKFGNGLVNLGDVNDDQHEDLLIQAYNASVSAGSGYVLYGSDNNLFHYSSGGPDRASGSVAPGSIGSIRLATGSALTTDILTEAGHGLNGFAGLGSFGAGDVNADGLNDILLGSGGNGQAYITWGKNYLQAINNLQLQKLASNTGYLLDGLATTTQGSLRSIGDFNGDGYGDFLSIQPGAFLDTVRLELGANTQEILADYPYTFYSFQVAPGTEVLPAGDSNGDGYADIALFLQQNLSSAADGNAGAGSTTGILYGRPSAQLPLGSGFGLLAPTDAAGNPLAPLPVQQIPGALSQQAPAMVAVGSTLYAVWCDASGNGNLWFGQSRDGGTSWSTATNLSAAVPALASSSTASLALFNNKLYLGFLNGSDQLALSSWDPASGTPTLWSTPTVLSEGTSNPTSNLSPALIANGDALSVVWVHGDGTSQTLQGASSTTPDLAVSSGAGPAFDWAPVAGATSPDTPALASSGSTVYMARRGSDNRLYWTASSDGGQSWGSWQPLPSGMTSNDAPSLAVVNGSLHLIYLGAANQELNITQLTHAATNTWSPQTVVSDQSAKQGLGAVAISETVSGAQGLAIYYVANNSTGTILRTWSATPLTAATWSASQRLGVSSTNPNGFTSSSPLAVTRFQGQTVLAYMGDASTTNTTAYIATAGDTPSTSGNWTTISTRNTGNQHGIGLGSDATGLLLNTTDSGTGQQAIYRLTPPAGSGSGRWSQSFYTSRASLSSSSATAAILSLPSSGSSPPQLLLAAADAANGDAVDASVLSPRSSWSAATPLLERIDTNGTLSFQPISATAAPSATLLNGAPVLAVNNNGTVNLYTGNGGKTVSLASSFSPGTSNQAGSTAAGITSTDTGLALSYRNSDGSVSLQRLNLLNRDGTPLEGVVINADGSLDTSNANLQWQGLNLDASSGLSTAVATAPLSVNGMLLLGNVSNNSGSTNQVRLSAVPNLSDPGSTSWLNSSVQLPDGQGGWMLQQQLGGSSLSAVGDITGDGNADLLVTAAAVQAGGSGSFTGLRLISGGATSSQILAANDATASSQTVQLAASFGGNRTTPVASRSGSSGGSPQLTLMATDKTSGKPYNLSTGYTLAGITASAGDLGSAQQLFSGAAAPLAGSPGLGLGFGDWGLNSSGTYGDLNADGYVDSLQGSPTTVYGADGLGWHLWSIRAAGDVNGNGSDDILLSLVPPETLLNGAPQWLQPVLLDGAMFAVDTNANSFSLTSLRAPLSPWSSRQLQDLNSSSSSQPWPLLQNWLQPILPFGTPQAPASISYTESKAPGWKPFPISEYNDDVHSITANSSDGSLKLFTQYLNASADSWEPGYITSYNPASGKPEKNVRMPSLFEGCFLGQAALYQGYLYIAAQDANRGLRLYRISEQDLEKDPSNGWSYQVIKDSSGSISSSLAPALVNEGDRLGLYFASNTNKGTLTYYYLKGAYNPDAPWMPGGNNGGEISSRYGNPINLFNLNGINSRPGTLMVSAAVSDGGTYVAYASNAADQNNPVACVIRKPANPGDGSGSWDAYNSIALPAGNNYLALTANQSQLTLVMGVGYEASSSPQTQLYTFSSYPDSPGDNANLSHQGSASFNEAMIGAGLLGSQLALLVREEASYFASLKLIGSPWNSRPSQQSLAGYSIDGNVDVNGDGFMDMLVSDPSDPRQNVNNQYALFGGDYLNIASQVGATGNDVMVGTPLADVIYTIQGADQVSSNGGADVIYTGAGDDAISIANNAFLRIDAGSGFDQLQLQGLANQSYDFRLNVPSPEYFAGTKLRDIELISSIDYGANGLSFDAAAIHAINPDRMLFLSTDARDSIALSSEFKRNTNFDTSYGGILWSAYAAAEATATPATSNPALLYVRTPAGQSVSWLNTNVRIAAPADTAPTAAAVPAAPRLAAGSAPADPLDLLPTTNPIAARQAFGDGLTLVGYRSNPATGCARFAIERNSSSRRQVIAYASSSANSSAEPGRHYSPVAGLLVLEAGQNRQEITVPIASDAFARLRGAGLSLAVEELADLGQKPLHLLLAPAAIDPAGATAPAAARAATVAAPPVLSGFRLTPASNGAGATLSFRADSNASHGGDALESLRLSVSRRRNADSAASETSQTLEILDARPGNGQAPLAYNAVPGALALDTDQRANGQIGLLLELRFTAANGEAAVSLAAPALQWQSALQLASDRTLQFSQDVPFTLWRADSGTAPVSFGLQGGGQSLILLRAATGGSSGSINPQSALSGDPLTGWRATEGIAIGARTAISNLALAGTAWTPTASRNGQALQLLGLSREGNQITASFAGGVTAVFGLQGSGQAPTATPIRSALQVQRLARYDNSLGLYALDDPITGRVDGLRPGEAGYLQKALARSEASGLLLTADMLPVYGASQRYSDLPLDPNRSYGALLLVNGDRSRLYSSFSAANPGGAVQVVNLGNSSTGLVLGFEDLSATNGDADYNDLVVNITRVSVPLF